LPDGKALIVGGQLTDGASIGSAEIYDPANGTFDVAGNMITPRCCHTATLLNSGRVLIVGGVSAATGYPTYQPVSALAAELYNPTEVIAGPTLYGLPGSGNAQGAIWDAFTGQPASADAPASAGAILSLYTAGLTSGATISPQVVLGGGLAEVLFFGDAPGFPGYYQVNFRVPEGVPSGLAVPLRLVYLGRWSNAVTIALR